MQAEGACGMADDYLYTASAEMPGGKGPFVPKEHSLKPVIGLFLTSFFSQTKRLI